MKPSKSGMLGAGDGLQVLAAPEATIGKEWQFTIAGVGNAHNFIVEFFNANGGIFRYFPNGEDEMAGSFTFHHAGMTLVLVTTRDDKPQVLETFMGTLEVVAEAKTHTGMETSIQMARAASPIMANIAPMASDMHISAAHACAPAPSQAADTSLTGVMDAKRDELLSRFKSKL